MFVKERVNLAKKKVMIFKKYVTTAMVHQANSPSVTLPGGLTYERLEHLYKEVRPYIWAEYQDITCPKF